MSVAGDNLQQIAKVLKSNGIDGELVLSFPYIDPEDIDFQEPVFIYFDGLPVPFFVESIVRRGNTKALVRLTDIESFDDAEEIIGRNVYMEDDALQGTYDEDDYSFLEGWTLYDGDSPVGTIACFVDIPANPCVEVLIAASGNTILVPLHDDLIEGIDQESRTIRMNLPQGLVE